MQSKRLPILLAALAMAACLVLWDRQPQKIDARERYRQLASDTTQLARPTVMAINAAPLAVIQGRSKDPLPPPETDLFLGRLPPPSTATVAAESPRIPDNAPPPLPFRFIGKRWSESGWEVFLALNDRVLIARPDEQLDPQYRVADITPPWLRLVHQPSGQSQTLNIGGKFDE